MIFNPDHFLLITRTVTEEFFFCHINIDNSLFTLTSVPQHLRPATNYILQCFSVLSRSFLRNSNGTYQMSHGCFHDSTDSLTRPLDCHWKKKSVRTRLFVWLLKMVLMKLQSVRIGALATSGVRWSRSNRFWDCDIFCVHLTCQEDERGKWYDSSFLQTEAKSCPRGEVHLLRCFKSSYSWW